MGGPDWGLVGQGTRQRARAERTWNMELMFLTLDVSRLSGWLNARANCRVETRACGVRGGGCGAAAAQAFCAGSAPD
eukprot:scaffold40116_cov59-Phaeocystis_antarctica.AAC.3